MLTETHKHSVYCQGNTRIKPQMALLNTHTKVVYILIYHCIFYTPKQPGIAIYSITLPASNEN